MILGIVIVFILSICKDMFSKSKKGYDKLPDEIDVRFC